MKKYIKILALIAVALLVFSMAACKKDKPTPSPTPNGTETQANKLHDFKGRTFRIRSGLLHDGNAWKTDSQADQLMRDRIEFLRQQCNGDYKLVGDGTHATDQGYILPSMVAGTPVVDLTDIGPFTIHQYISKNCIVPIEAYAEETEMNNPDLWDQSCQEMLDIKGQRYALVPRYSKELLVGQTRVLFFNKTLLQESNVTEDLYQLQRDKQWTWDKFSQMAVKVTKDTNGDGKTDIWGAGGNNHSLLLGFIVANGGNMFAPNEKGEPDIMFDKQPAREAFQYLVDLTVKKKAMRPRPVEEGGGIDVPLFSKGYMGFTSEYCNRIDPQIGRFSSMKDEFGILMFPLAPNKTEYKVPFDYYMGWSVVSNVEHPEDVAEFISFFWRPLMSVEETDASFEVTFTEFLRDEESMETLNMINWDTLVVDQSGAYIVPGTSADATYLIVDGTELAFLGEQTVQQYYDEQMPVLQQRLKETWTNVLD